MKKTLMLCAMMAAMFANSPLHAQSEAKGSVMTVRVCDFDTLKADDTTILGYVFLEQYYLDERETSVAMKVYRPTLDDIRNAEKLLRNKYTYIMSPEKTDKFGRETRPRLKWYTRQYVFGVDETGKKYVWINALRLENDKSYTERVSKHIIRVRDGGNYFWNVLLNITDGKVLSVMTNGEA